MTPRLDELCAAVVAAVDATERAPDAFEADYHARSVLNAAQELVTWTHQACRAGEPSIECDHPGITAFGNCEECGELISPETRVREE